jgi:glutaredoxin
MSLGPPDQHLVNGDGAGRDDVPCGHVSPMNPTDRSDQASITFYTRPRCPYSFRLRRALRRRRLEFTEVNIWTDPDAAAAVRAVADGNETVPTLLVAGRWLVNPSADEVERLARGRATQ